MKKNLCDTCQKANDCSFKRMVLNNKSIITECINYEALSLGVNTSLDDMRDSLAKAGLIHGAQIKAVEKDGVLSCPNCGDIFEQYSEAFKHSCSCDQSLEKEESKEFSSRFMPNVKFKVKGELEAIDLQKLTGTGNIFYGYITNKDGDFFSACDSGIIFEFNEGREVSTYEAIPELVPDGFYYDKEVDELVEKDQKSDSCSCHQFFDDSNSDLKGIIKKKYDFNVDTLPFHKGHFDDILKNSLNNAGKKIQEDIRKSSGFVKHDSDKIRYDLVCPYAYEDLGKVLTFGAKKYEDNNWMKGDINTYIAAMQRHLNEVKKAVNSGNNDLFIDDDSGLQHGAALMVNGMFIHWFINQKNKGGK